MATQHCIICINTSPRDTHRKDEVCVKSQNFPCCEFCNIQVPNDGSLRHEQSATCVAATTIWVQHRRAVAGHHALQWWFTAYQLPEIKQVDLFKYPGHPFSNTNHDVSAMRNNIKKARAILLGFSNILQTKEIAAPVLGMFCQAVVTAVLLYGSESWYLPPLALKVLKGFHVVAAWRLTRMMPKKRGDLWTYPKTPEVLTAARPKTMTKYITIRRQYAAVLVIRRPILVACRRAEMMHGTARCQY